jgi:hypothetical protein
MDMTVGGGLRLMNRLINAQRQLHHEIFSPPVDLCRVDEFHFRLGKLLDNAETAVKLMAVWIEAAGREDKEA